MSLRTFRERILQTIAFEAGGIALVGPAYALVFGASAPETLTIVLALSLAAMVWSPMHNSAFDWLDLRLTGRVASDRPQKLRLIHALSHEVTVMVVTLPMLMALGGHSFAAALLVDIGFSLAYAAYAYVFHMVYDRWRPVSG
jgi:uncharacterized membrane protein